MPVHIHGTCCIARELNELSNEMKLLPAEPVACVKLLRNAQRRTRNATPIHMYVLGSKVEPILVSHVLCRPSSLLLEISTYCTLVEWRADAVLSAKTPCN